MNDREILVEVKNLNKYFPINKGIFSYRQKGVVKAVDDISFSIKKGETLGLIGESGCGKTTVSRVLLGLIKKTSGKIYYENQEINKNNIEDFRRKTQMIFQDPYSSLDPRMCVRRIIEEPLRIHTDFNSKQKEDIVCSIIDKIGIDKDALNKYPHEFSGGQRQRIGIARALVLGPKFIVCDEPVSALDMSIQAQILNLFKKMQKDFDLTYLFISHDMSVIKHVSNRIAVMYLGKIVEMAEKEDLFKNTLHPYTVALMSAIPVPNPSSKKKRIILEGDLPTPLNPPSGCNFRTRCPKACDICKEESPELKEIKNGHYVACHLIG